MDERAFVERRRSDWERLQAILNRATSYRGLKSLSAQELTDFGKLYRRAASDLAYCKANSVSEELIDYLNDIAGRAHGALYSDSSSNGISTIIRFLLQGFPILFREKRRFIAAATALFLIGAIFAGVKIHIYPESGSFITPSG